MFKIECNQIKVEEEFETLQFAEDFYEKRISIGAKSNNDCIRDSETGSVLKHWEGQKFIRTLEA